MSSIKVPYGYIVKLTEKSGHESILLSEGNYNDLGKFGWDNYAATAEVKHYSALEYELQAARVQKVKEVVSAREKELNTALRGDAIAQKTDVGVDNLRVEPVEGNHEEKTELIFTGNTRLTNTTDQKQTLTSQAFDFAREQHDFGDHHQLDRYFGFGFCNIQYPDGRQSEYNHFHPVQLLQGRYKE